jgi:two-component system KDP operon response regulator KdpE
MVAQPTEMLLVSANNIKLLNNLKEDAYRIHKIDDPGKAMETLRDTAYDLILLDDALFGGEIVSMVQEIKRRVPLVPVLVLSGNSDATYQTDLMEAGADDFLTASLSSDEFQRRLRLLLRQRRQNRALARRTANLQAITTVSRRIHSASDPHTLIQDTIDIACSTFKLYGMAIMLGEGDTFQIYAGAEGKTDALFESMVYPHEYDPFRRAIQSGFVQVFQDINADPYYTAIPVLPRAESAIIVPLNYQDYKFGAMAVFGTTRHPLSNDDLLIYELFAGQFTLALHNARYYHSQRISVQFSQHLLKAWQRFVSLQNYEDIADTLHQFVQDVPNVGKALIWLYSSEAGDMIVNAESDEGRKIFGQLVEQGEIVQLIAQMDEHHLQPLTLHPRPGQKDPLGPLFRYLRGQQLVLVPITDSARLIGGVIASVVTSRQYTAEDARLLIESLAHAAGQALERTTLMAAMVEKSGRLEALLLSVSEGIFFVDDTDRVAFANPQFSELTGVAPSRVMGQEPAGLLEMLAEQAQDADRVREQLHSAISSVLSPHAEAGNYPIVEMRLENPPRDLHIEFLNIGKLNVGEAGWACIVLDKSRFQITFNPQSALLDVMSEQVRLPYAHVRGLLGTLGEQHSRFTHRERARFLRQIEESVENLGQLWDNFLEVYQLEAAGAKLAREESDLYDVVQRVLDSRAFSEYRRQIHVEAPSQLSLVEVDELRIEQVLMNVLHNAFKFSPKGANIVVSLGSQGRQVFVSVRDQGIGIPADQLERVFEPFYRATNNSSEEGAGLGLYLSRELIRKHGGEMWIDSAPGKGTTITFALPALGEEVVIAPTPSYTTVTQQARRVEVEEPVRERARATGAARVTERQPQTIMVVEGQSSLVKTLEERLDEQGYELIVYEAGEEALRDVNSVRLDLILVDVDLPDANGLDVCERMCKRTEVPIILLADEASEAEKVRALNIGADDYIARPISNDELMARVNVIFKRRRIPDRQREPLDLGALYVDFARREVYLNNKPLELTRIEYDLLHTLSVNMGQVLTHKQLLEKVWGPEYQAETQYLWVNVSRLRKKLEPTPDSPRYIQTQPGVGYVFRVP